MSIEPPDTLPLPPDQGLKWLKALVIGLTATMIAGLLTIVGLLVMIFVREPAPGAIPQLPEGVSIPADETTLGVTFGTGWLGVVTRDGVGQERVRILDAETGVERAAIEIEAAD